MLEKITSIFRGHKAIEYERILSPSCFALLRTYSFEDSPSIITLGFYPEKNAAEIVFSCLVTSRHKYFVQDAYVSRRIEVAFKNVTSPSITNRNQPLAYNQIVRLEYEHDVDEFELSATCYYEHRDKIFHTHTLKIIAEDLIVMFPFEDLSFREISSS